MTIRICKKCGQRDTCQPRRDAREFKGYCVKHQEENRKKPLVIHKVQIVTGHSVLFKRGKVQSS